MHGQGTTKTHCLYGLMISSELVLPLPVSEGESEVTVTLGEVMAGGDLLWRTEPPLAFACYRRDDTIILDWPEARFAIEADRVVVDPAEPAFAVDLFLNPVWSVVLAARGRQALHACVVERDGLALSIHGVSGAGKTTSGLALLDRGWRLVTDDLLAFDADCRVVPGPPFIRLLPDRITGRAGQIDSAGKLRYRPALCENPVRLSAMLVLDDEHPTCMRLTGLAAVNAVLAQVYNPVLTHPGQSSRHFELALDLAERLPVYGAPPRSLLADQLERLVQLVTARTPQLV
ncbi:MAG: hypothetical protein ACR2LS_09455 [Thermomicrobiales bacterium]